MPSLLHPVFMDGICDSQKVTSWEWEGELAMVRVASGKVYFLQVKLNCGEESQGSPCGLPSMRSHYESDRAEVT